MNTLTKNRILEKGDLYKDGEKWKLVPSTDWGLQIQFTKYTEVQRPTEQGSQTVRQESAKLPIEGSTPSPASTISPDSDSASADQPPISGPVAEPAKAEAKRVPDIGVSPDVGESLTSTIDKEIPLNEIFIPYPSATAKRRHPIWIGRNGTFNAKALTIMNGTGSGDGIIKVIPHGSRGQARNAIIEFPAEIIPQVIDFLLRHQPVTTTKE